MQLIETAKIYNDNGVFQTSFNFKGKHKCIIDFDVNSDVDCFSIEIIFKEPIAYFRNHDYTWSDLKKDRVSSWYAPKIIKLKTGIYVQSNCNLGIWEVKKNDDKILLWHFNPENSAPILDYVGKENTKKIEKAKVNMLPQGVALLFSEHNAVEVSRSKYPFSAITCFTDHCDFDSLENLKMQRQFFASNNIKTTKGFFLNQFSKREDNASFELHSKELLKWKEDGHELAYHSLSQSIKSEEESISDFKNFSPPVSGINVWIDHGYQPYNFTLYKSYNFGNEEYENIIDSKGLNTLWNYVDSGTATNGVINQINPEHFTIGAFYKGIKDTKISFKMRLSQLIKNLMFHYFNSDKTTGQYIKLASYFKSVFLKKRIKNLPNLVINFFALVPPILKVIIFWRKTSKKVYPLARFTPLFFKHTIFDKDFYVFQTIEMVDFKSALNKKNIDTLINESGVFIAHTYFSVPLGYHHGKMFKSSTEIDNDVIKNFEYISKKIDVKKIWNPTLSQLIDYMWRLNEIVFDIDSDGRICIENADNMHYRIIT